MVTFFKALDSRHQSSLGSSLAPFSTACTTITCFFQAYQKMSAIVNLEMKKCASSIRFLAFCFDFGTLCSNNKTTIYIHIFFDINGLIDTYRPK